MTPDQNKVKLWRWPLPFVCSIVFVMLAPFSTAKETVSGQTLSVPPSVELAYTARVKYSAMSIGGTSTMKWQHADNEYVIQASTRANMLGKILDTTSQGQITPQSLKPYRYTEKRRNRAETQTTFNYQNQTLTFSDSDKSIAFKVGTQDRASIVWQLAAMAKTAPEKFLPGSKLVFMGADRNRIDTWDFKVLEEETLHTPLGDLSTVHLIKDDPKGKTIEVWLAPDKEWYPVKLIFSDNKDLRLEQTIKKITAIPGK